MNEFGKNAIAGNGYALPSEERMARSLDGTLPAHIPAMSVGKIDNVSRARIRRAFAELAQGNIENVERWLHEVAATSPKIAIELFMELAKFTIPQVKAIAIDVNDGKGGAKRLTMAELHSIVSEQ
jgi:hypothetical protein